MGAGSICYILHHVFIFMLIFNLQGGTYVL